MVDYSEINLLGILVAAAASMILGMIWYHPKVFGKTWMELTGRDMASGDSKAMVVAALASVISASTLAAVLLGFAAIDWVDGIGVGALVGVGVAGMTIVTNDVFEGRKIELLLLNVTYHTVNFTAMGAILGAFQAV